jgi:hypothetical protein
MNACKSGAFSECEFFDACYAFGNVNGCYLFATIKSAYANGRYAAVGGNHTGVTA